MNYNLDEALDILSRTPVTLDALLRGLPEPWVHANEGPGSWSPFDVVGHLIHGEETDWIERLKIILEERGEPFTPFDREGHVERSRGKTLDQLLDTFAGLRAGNVMMLRDFNLQPADLDKTGRHPELGPVTARQLLATWVAHDLGHVAQVTRVMAKQYTDEVGPWKVYLGVLSTRLKPSE